MVSAGVKLQRGRPGEQDASLKEQNVDVAARDVITPAMAPTIKMGPTIRWVGLETLVDVVLEGCDIVARADSGSQVNTMMPEFVKSKGYLVLPLEELVIHPLHLFGLGGQWTHPMGFIIARLQVKEMVGYDEDAMFLVFPDESAFSGRVPVMLGTCTFSCVISFFKESELEWISTPWSTVHFAQLLLQQVVTDASSGNQASKGAP